MTAFVVTFDVFSALIDSRVGGSAFFSDRAASSGWLVPGSRVYDAWDATNKAFHARPGPWRPFAELAEAALADVYRDLGLVGDVAADCRDLLAGMPLWPLWPDVDANGLRRVSRRLGLLTNIDDVLLAGTTPLGLGCFDPGLILTSERLGSYKPAPVFYSRARSMLGPVVHVASSARDVRGALEAGLPCVRLARPGHRVDTDGPTPEHVVDSVSQLPSAVAAVGASFYGS